MARQSQHSFFRFWAIALLCLGAAGLAGPAVAQSYLTPDGTAPSANSVPVAPPLNSSASIQRKEGTLLIGSNGGSAKLCLNADTDSDTSGRCIDSWDDVTTSIGGPFLHYDNSTLYTVATGKLPASYSPRPGFARVNGTCSVAGCPAGSIQLYSYLTAAPTGNNSIGSQITGAYGLYATDGGVATNYAGYFSGTLHIYPTIPSATLGQLCLNGLTANIDCVDDWRDVSNGGGSYLLLQALNATPTPNPGSFSISGTGEVGSIIIDSPNATMSRTITCGDGMCTSVNGEDAVTCALDCGALPVLTAAGVTPNVGNRYCSLDHFTQCSSNTTCTNSGKGICQVFSGDVRVTAPAQAHIIVVRSKTNPPTFVPLQGSTYSTGTVHGDSTIIYAGKPLANLTNAIVERDQVTSSGTYHYRAFIGNAYPRYGTPYTPSTDASITYSSVSVSKAVNGGIPYSTTPDTQILCGTGTAFCTGFYRTGTTVSIDAEVLNAGYSWLGWTGCQEPSSPAITTCTVVVNTDKVVYANYQETSGGPGGGGGPLFDL